MFSAVWRKNMFAGDENLLMKWKNFWSISLSLINHLRPPRLSTKSSRWFRCCLSLFSLHWFSVGYSDLPKQHTCVNVSWRRYRLWCGENLWPHRQERQPGVYHVYMSNLVIVCAMQCYKANLSTSYNTNSKRLTGPIFCNVWLGTVEINTVCHTEKVQHCAISSKSSKPWP